MLGASPALVKMPWMRSSGAMCWRRAATFMYPRTAASSALRPFCGAAAAWAALPVVGRRGTAGWRWRSCCRRSAPAGCTIIAASTPSNAPRSAMKTLPPPPSSAGVPRIRRHRPAQVGRPARRRPGRHRGRPRRSRCGRRRGRCRAGRRTRRAPRSSARRSRPRPRTQSTTRRRCRSTVRPSCSAGSVSRSWAWCSSKPSSGCSWIECEASSSTSPSRSTSAITRSLAASTWSRVIEGTNSCANGRPTHGSGPALSRPGAGRSCRTARRPRSRSRASG